MAKLIGGIALLAVAVGLAAWACGVSPAKSAAIGVVIAGVAIAILVGLLLFSGDR